MRASSACRAHHIQGAMRSDWYCPTSPSPGHPGRCDAWVPDRCDTDHSVNRAAPACRDTPRAAGRCPGRGHDRRQQMAHVAVPRQPAWHRRPAGGGQGRRGSRRRLADGRPPAPARPRRRRRPRSRPWPLMGVHARACCPVRRCQRSCEQTAVDAVAGHGDLAVALQRGHEAQRVLRCHAGEHADRVDAGGQLGILRAGPAAGRSWSPPESPACGRLRWPSRHGRR